MKERPILFSGEMVRAILDGRKTQTRRVIKPQPIFIKDLDGLGIGEFLGWHKSKVEFIDSIHGSLERHCPYGQPGDRIWVRETFAARFEYDQCKPTEIHPTQNIFYLADGKTDIEKRYPEIEHSSRGKWRPSIFMPHWASRITLEIVNVRVERVQDISDEDAISEGVTLEMRGRGLSRKPRGPRMAYARLWDSINAKRGYGWDTNPFVWCIEFNRVEK